jgi:hypothetical protein
MPCKVATNWDSEGSEGFPNGVPSAREVTLPAQHLAPITNIILIPRTPFTRKENLLRGGSHFLDIVGKPTTQLTNQACTNAMVSVLPLNDRTAILWHPGAVDGTQKISDCTHEKAFL